MPKFVDTSPPGQCLFCRLVASEIPSARVYEDDLVIAFMDIAQVNPGHILIATKRHATTNGWHKRRKCFAWALCWQP